MSATKTPKVSANVLGAILNSHTKDLVVTECKDGPTWSGGHLRMDVWTMKRSWSHPRMVGYEIKHSRADYKQDTKWTGYLQYCNELFFACPKGLLQPEEMPDGIGLVWATGERMRVVKKAAWRDVVPPPEFFYYILMCRTRIVRPNYYDSSEPTYEMKLSKWREWLAQREEAKELGYEVSRGVRERVAKIESRNHQLERENEKLAEAKAILEKLDVNVHSWDLERRIKAAASVVPPELVSSVDAVQQACAVLKSNLAKIEHEKKKE